MPQQQLKIGVKAEDQRAIGGDSNAEAWMDSADNGKLTGRGKDNNVVIQFATGGTESSPSWGPQIPLSSTGNDFDEDRLQDGIDAGFQTSLGDRYVLIQVTFAEGDNYQFEAYVDGSWENDWLI